MVKETAGNIYVPQRFVGPIKFTGDVQGDVCIPLATFETPLWPSTNRGAKVSRLSGGVCVTLIQSTMTRSVVVEAASAAQAFKIVQDLESRTAQAKHIVEQTTKYGQFESLYTRIVGKLLYIRLSMTTGNASGHNMVTKAADALLQWILSQYKDLAYVSVSGNLCADKKVSAVNAILGRGKSVIAEMTIPCGVCREVLKTTPEKLHELNIRKNLTGSIVAGSTASANAHFANILLAFYLATGQDAANIVEGSQGITQTDILGKDLYISATLPNLIVGTVGNGKHQDFAKINLQKLGCLEDNQFQNSQRLACLIAGATLCGEISLLAAQTNFGELMHSHTVFERGVKVCR